MMIPLPSDRWSCVSVTTQAGRCLVTRNCGMCTAALRHSLVVLFPATQPAELAITWCWDKWSLRVHESLHPRASERARARAHTHTHTHTRARARTHACTHTHTHISTLPPPHTYPHSQTSPHSLTPRGSMSACPNAFGVLFRSNLRVASCQSEGVMGGWTCYTDHGMNRNTPKGGTQLRKGNELFFLSFLPCCCVARPFSRA